MKKQRLHDVRIHVSYKGFTPFLLLFSDIKKLQAFDSAYGMMERKEVINENTDYKTGCNLIPKNLQQSQTELLFSKKRCH